MQTTETFSTDPISIESDGESTTKSETDCEPAPVRQQGMFIWNQQYQVRGETRKFVCENTVFTLASGDN